MKNKNPGLLENSRFRNKRKILLGILAVCISIAKAAAVSSEENSANSSSVVNKSDHRTWPAGQDGNCTRAAIEEFPRFPLDAKQRANGGILLPIIIALYLILALGTICDEYFVPALEMICDVLGLSSDVAGATFMAAGTSSPEFFTNIMGTFVTKSNLGIGTIVGSAVFNIFGVISVCGLFAGRKIYVDWYPITRDSVIYGITVILLILVLIDEKVFWWESVIMLGFYLIYIIIMIFNSKVETWAHSLCSRMKKQIQPQTNGNGHQPSQNGTSNSVTSCRANEATPLHLAADKNAQVPVIAITSASSDFGNNNQLAIEEAPSTVALSTSNYNSIIPPSDEEDASAQGSQHTNISEGGDEVLLYPWQCPPNAGVFGSIWWLLFLPINLLLFLTIPDMRRVDDQGDELFSKLYPLSFVMCMAWIGAISYVVTWMITLIGFDIGVPDSVMGLSFLAVGTSIPEVFSSLIVSKQGKGAMAVSNSIGSNTFDILVCLGLPWLARAVQTGLTNEDYAVNVSSEGITYTVISLLLSLFVLYILLVASKFVLNKTVGVICLVVYGVFLALAIMFELNIFFVVNLPTCFSNF